MKVQKHVEVTIIMTEAEAKWLKEMLQNPLSENESEAEGKTRQSFWDALHREEIR